MTCWRSKILTSGGSICAALSSLQVGTVEMSPLSIGRSSKICSFSLDTVTPEQAPV
jgi:hypothetical protein